MSFEFSPSLLHHPPFGVSCSLLLIFAFPLISLAILYKRPFLPVTFFYTPLLLSVPIAAYVLFLTVRGAMLAGSFSMLAWGIAESMAVIGYGAASSFASALFNLRVRRRAMYPVFPITLAIAVAAWVGAHAVMSR